MSSLLAARQNILRSGRGATVPLQDIILTAPQSVIEFPDLIGDADAEYILRIWGVVSAAAPYVPYIIFNDDTGANYEGLYDVTDDSVGGSNSVSELLAQPQINLTTGGSSVMGADTQLLSEIKISGKSGKGSGHIVEIKSTIIGGVDAVAMVSGRWDSVAEINNIKIKSASPFQTSRWAVGSRFQLFTF